MAARPDLQAMLIMALNGLAYAMVDVSQTFLVEQALCRQFYASSDPDVILPDGSVPESRCKIKPVQSEVAVLSGLLTWSILMVGFLITPLWTRLASSIGKRTVLLINAVGLVLATLAYSSVFYFYNLFNVHMVLGLCVFTTVGGGIPVREIMLSMYIAENVPDDRLSDAFYTLTALLIGMGSLGSFLGSLILRVDVWQLCATATGIYAVTIPAVWFLPQSSPSQAIEQQPELADHSTSSSFLLSASKTHSPEHEGVVQQCRLWCGSIRRVLTVELPQSLMLFVDAVREPLTRRVMAICFSSTMAMTVHNTFQQWASSNFHWKLASVNTLWSMGQVVSAAVLLALPLLSHGILRPLLGTKRRVDLWVALISIIFSAVGCLVLSVSPSILVYGFGLVVYSLGIGLNDSLRSLATSALQDTEAVQRLYMGIRTVQSLGAMIGIPLWSSLLSLILRSDGALPKGLTFFGASSLYFLSLYWGFSLQRFMRNVYVSHPAI
ncbi:major facilitator superfamily domain-containing protein [Aspergillus pseudotamarii]|uniref:Major facilitator superfamily domain-containing protein n=1 Tax=Aspergillus pseudotamarii TaxID=132259 RepID=A0A5N6SS56_ASPPS|nr:major facilitator superfamily domain-containing protein [Aspergillus pseudotamarii]KAE8137455.1 major facilitator superfamily domain-containing protein [Aspergillus pseudotamarii]